MIELCDFSIGYAEKRLLDKVDASFKRGQLTALIGRNRHGEIYTSPCHSRTES